MNWKCWLKYLVILVVLMIVSTMSAGAQTNYPNLEGTWTGTGEMVWIKAEYDPVTRNYTKNITYSDNKITGDFTLTILKQIDSHLVGQISSTTFFSDPFLWFNNSIFSGTILGGEIILYFDESIHHHCRLISSGGKIHIKGSFGIGDESWQGPQEIRSFKFDVTKAP